MHKVEQSPDRSREKQLGTVIHLHIPKTAGSSLNKILSRNFQNRVRYSFHTPESIRNFVFMTADQRKSIDLFFGHVHYGFVDFFGKNHTVVSILREPVSRVYSYYRYLYENNEHPDHHLVGKRRLSFDGFLIESEERKAFKFAINNYQVRALAGDLSLDINIEKRLDSSLENSEKSNCLIGIQEHFSEFIIKCANSSIISDTNIAKENLTNSQDTLSEAIDRLSVRSRDLLYDYVRYDEVLYKNVCRQQGYNLQCFDI